MLVLIIVFFVRCTCVYFDYCVITMRCMCVYFDYCVITMRDVCVSMPQTVSLCVTEWLL